MCFERASDVYRRFHEFCILLCGFADLRNGGAHLLDAGRLLP